MKKIILLIIIFFSIPFLLSAGRYAGDFMLIGPGVRPLGMGGAFAAVADDGSATYWNPAGLSQLDYLEIEIMRSFLYENLAAYDFVAVCIPLPAKTTIGLSFTQLTIDKIHLYEEKWLVGNVDIRSSDIDLHLTGEPDGYFDSSDQLFSFAFAKNVSQIIDFGWELFDLPVEYYFGGMFKYIKRNVYKNIGTGMGFDLSFMIKTDFALLTDVDWLGSIKFGTSIQDIAGTTITWDTKSKHADDVITNAKFGFAVVQPVDFINSEIIAAFDWDNIYKYTKHLGLEINYSNLLSIRTGINHDRFTAGISIRYKKFIIDYAFLTNDELGNSNRIGLRMNL